MDVKNAVKLGGGVYMFSPYPMIRLTTLSGVAVTVDYTPRDLFTSASSDPTEYQYEAAIRLCQDAIEKLNADKEKRYGRNY